MKILKEQKQCRTDKNRYVEEWKGIQGSYIHLCSSCHLILDEGNKDIGMKRQSLTIGVGKTGYRSVEDRKQINTWSDWSRIRSITTWSNSDYNNQLDLAVIRSTNENMDYVLSCLWLHHPLCCTVFTLTKVQLSWLTVWAALFSLSAFTKVSSVA